MKLVSARTIIVLSLGLGVAIGLGFVFQDQLLKIDNITIESVGEEKFLFERIRDQLNPGLKEFKGQYLWEVDLKKILALIEGDRRVQKVHITRQLPNSILIRIQPHRPILSLWRADGSIIPVAKDASLLPKTFEYSDLPVLRGDQFLLDAEKRSRAIAMVEQLPKGGPLSLGKISEIKYDADDGFYLFLTGSGAQVKLGQDQFALRAGLVERVLDYLENQQMQARVIDARFSKKVVVRLRNAP